MRMTMDLLTLLQRDHDDIVGGLTQLADPEATAAEIRTALDGVRLGLTAHAEAEDIVMYHVLVELAPGELVNAMVARMRAMHLEQESGLSSLVCATPGTTTWRDRAVRLRDLVRSHATYEEEHVLPAIRSAAPAVYDRLAGAFATERLRQLAMLQPSAPIYVADLARAQASA